MEALRKVEGVVAVLDRADVDTDQIIPKQFLKRIERTGYGAFLFNDHYSRPEKVDKPSAVSKLGDTLFVACDCAPPNVEYLEEFVVKTLRLALLVSRIVPFFGKGSSAGANLIPR